MKTGSSVWKNNVKIIEALTTKIEDFNSKMLNKRFEFLTRSYQKLDKIIPEKLKVPIVKIL